jgi:hypothetical protein
MNVAKFGYTLRENLSTTLKSVKVLTGLKF